jgi:tetratricopeptide (TPR) repeat protein
VAEVIASHFLDAYQAAGSDEDAGALREQALTEAAAGMAKRAARWEQAVELYEAVAEMHESAGRREDARRVIGLMARPMRYADREDEAFERMRAAVAELDPGQLVPEVAELNLELGLALSLRGQREEAVEPLERALTAAEALELPALLCESLMTAGFGYGFAGRVEQERALYQRATEIAEQHELRPELMAACAYLGESLAQTDSPDADDANHRSLSLARRLGDRSFERYVAGNVIYRLLLTGDWEGIDSLVEEVMGGSGETGEEFFVHQRLIHLAVMRGQLDGAAEHIERRDAGQDATDFEFEVLSRAAEATVALAQGQAPDAHDRALAVLDDAPRLGPAHEAIRVAWPLAVEAALVSGRLESAAALVDEMEHRPPGFVPPFLRAELHRNRGLLAAARGDQDAVEADLIAAVDLYEELRYPFLLARAQTDLGSWLIDCGRRDDASGPLEAARETLTRLRAVPAAERVVHLLEPDAVPSHL